MGETTQVAPPEPDADVREFAFDDGETVVPLTFDGTGTEEAPESTTEEPTPEEPVKTSDTEEEVAPDPWAAFGEVTDENREFVDAAKAKFKSPLEMLRGWKNQEQFIGKQGSELGELRKAVEELKSTRTEKPETKQPEIDEREMLRLTFQTMEAHPEWSEEKAKLVVRYNLLDRAEKERASKPDGDLRRELDEIKRKMAEQTEEAGVIGEYHRLGINLADQQVQANLNTLFANKDRERARALFLGDPDFVAELYQARFANGKAPSKEAQQAQHELAAVAAALPNRPARADAKNARQLPREVETQMRVAWAQFGKNNWLSRPDVFQMSHGKLKNPNDEKEAYEAFARRMMQKGSE